ncbi:glycosyltransferase family 2 protein [Geobacter anodireducens]
MPKVSVIISTYNSEEYIQEAKLSILNQNYDDFEITVVDDGSSDNIFHEVHSLDSDKIRYIQREENHGGPSIFSYFFR